jgi:predicted ATP-binding protein involved in virulence
MFDNVEKMSPEEMISELRRWHFCYRDAPDNFDARLIKRSIEIIQDLLDKTEFDNTTPESKWCNDYTALIENGIHTTDEGVELRAKIAAHYGEHHSVMLDFNRLIRWQAFKKKTSKV